MKIALLESSSMLQLFFVFVIDFSGGTGAIQWSNESYRPTYHINSIWSDDIITTKRSATEDVSFVMEFAVSVTFEYFMIFVTTLITKIKMCHFFLSWKMLLRSRNPVARKYLNPVGTTRSCLVSHMRSSQQKIFSQSIINTLRPRQMDAIFKCIFLNENIWISIKISLKFVPRGPINKIPALVQIMAWRRPGDKPLSEPMVVGLPTH